MQDLMGQHSAKCRRIQCLHKVGVVVDRDSIGSHCLNRSALPPLQAEQERTKERMVEQQGRARLLEVCG